MKKVKKRLDKLDLLKVLTTFNLLVTDPFPFNKVPFATTH